MAIAAACAAATTADAQGTRADELRATRARLDRLTARWRVADSVLKAFDDSVGRSRAALDTVRAGNLRILVSKALRAEVEASARRRAGPLDTLLGTATARLTRHWIVVRQRNDSTLDTAVVAYVAKPGKAYPEGREIDVIWGPVADTLYGRGFRTAAMHLVWSDADNPVSRWLNAELNPDTTTAVAWTTVRLTLASDQTTAGHKCWNGDIDACKVMLRLVPLTDAPTQFFDSAGRRQHVERNTGLSDEPHRTNCLRGDDKACRALMAFEQWSVIPPNLLSGTVAQLAVRMGGSTALDRLIATQESPARALAITAGVPIDSVLRVWVRNARERRLPSEDMSAGIAAGSLMWILVCGVLAMRSSRWR